MVAEILVEETITIELTLNVPLCSMLSAQSVAQPVKFPLNPMAEKKSSVVNVLNKMAVVPVSLSVGTENPALGLRVDQECSIKETLVDFRTGRCSVRSVTNVARDVKCLSDRPMVSQYCVATVLPVKMSGVANLP